MEKNKNKIKTPKQETPFNPKTDKCLRYFSTKEAFVRHREFGGYKLYCDNGKCVPMYIDTGGFLYIYQTFQPRHEPYADAFLNEYAPHFSITKAKLYYGISHYEYTGIKVPIRT